MSILLNNKILQAVEDKIEAGLTAQNRDDYMKIVVSGMKVALADGPNGYMGKLKASQQPMRDAVFGAINLVMLMSRQAQGKMPERAMVPAAMTLMLKALDFLDRSKVLKIGAEELGQATRMFTNHIFNVFKISPGKLTSMAGQVNGIMEDPTAMEKIKLRVGATKDPRAPTPTLPEEEKTDGV